jgi:hypothetical protein
MIGKPEWFGRRKYGGWGIYPKKWQAWAYMGAVFLPFVIFQALPFWDNPTRTIVTIVWIGLFALDSIHIMLNLKKDEMEKKIEAIAERNAAWTMVAVIAAGVAFEVARSAVNREFAVDPFLIGAIVAGLLAKAGTNIYLERKGV